MGDNEEFEKNVKLSFSKVKDHITNVEDRVTNVDNELKKNKEEIKQYKEEIANLRKEIESLKNKHDVPMETQKPQEPQNQGFKEVSSGNQGVYSFIQSFAKHSFNSYANKIFDFKQDFDKLFAGLSQQEFLTFLTIYQLEEEIKQVSYIDVAKKLNLTEGCVRTYVSSLLKKGLPLIKKKYNNRQVFLLISPDFRSLNLKQKLVDTFYHSDSNQKTLNNQF